MRLDKPSAFLFGCLFALCSALGVAAGGEPRSRDYVKLMTAGSLKMSHTISDLSMRTNPDAWTLANKARTRFVRTARYVVENHASLAITAETADKLNAMLVNDTPTPNRVHPMRLELFEQWLNSEAYDKLARSGDAVQLASEAHHQLVHAHPFWRDGDTGGNGRTARFMADLILLQRGRPPFHYDSVEHYYASVRAADPAVRLEYYRKAAERAEAFLRAQPSAVAPP